MARFCRSRADVTRDHQEAPNLRPIAQTPSLRWAGRRWTPPCIGRDAQPTYPALHRAKTPNPQWPPCTVGRASCARLPGIVPGSDGVNDTRIVPLALWCVRVFLLGRIVVTCAGQGGAGPRPASGEDAQPTNAIPHSLEQEGALRQNGRPHSSAMRGHAVAAIRNDT